MRCARFIGPVAKVARVARIATIATAAAVFGTATDAQDTVVVGSKAFTESHLLGEMMRLMLEAHTELDVTHRGGLGGTLICHEALVAGEIDVYAEYTGTAWTAVLGSTDKTPDAMRAYLEVQTRYREQFELEWLQPFGLNNTYVLAMQRARATELGIRSVSDLTDHPDLRAGFSPEFLNRPDGYPGLAAAYGLEIGRAHV